MRKLFISLILILLSASANAAQVENYALDIKGAHAFVQFRIKHLGYSWLYGRFNKFDGSFHIDRENLENSSINVTIETNSIDSNHAERDKHLRGEDFLDVAKYPEAVFKSTALKLTDEKDGVLTGDLTLHGVTKPVEIEVSFVGEGKDPWGGYRMGFEGSTTLTLSDFGITYDLGPASTQVEMILAIEGIKK